MRRLAAALAALALVAAQPAFAQEATTPPAAAPAPTQTLPSADEVQSFEPGEQPPAPRPATGAPASPAPAEPAAPADSASPLPGDTTMADPSTEPAVDPAALPHDLSPWGMFVAADWVVKAVMIGLAFASVVTWTVWLAKSLEILGANRRAKAGLAAVETARALGDARRTLGGARGPVSSFVAAADAELLSSSDALSPEGVKERVASHLSRLEAQAGRRLAIGTGVLATIGSTAPFVGLFGTVWGIMNSFIGISNAQTTNLAVVAPGIAEALLATAIGLVAAIPAVMIYNVFARAISAHRALLADASAAVLCLVSRDLDRGIAPRLARAAE